MVTTDRVLRAGVERVARVRLPLGHVVSIREELVVGGVVHDGDAGRRVGGERTGFDVNRNEAGVGSERMSRGRRGGSRRDLVGLPLWPVHRSMRVRERK